MENVRVDSLLGNKKVIVGNPHSDLVLETLGKVYIKSGRNCKLLDDVIKELATISEKPQEEVYAKTIIVNSIDELQSLDYPGDGYLIYNSLNKSLYISYEDKYIALIEASADEGESYVRKTGDVMTGPLELTETAQAPLIVHSKRLINNLNANYLQGYSGEEFAKKKENEIISGNWTFTGQNISRANWRFYRNIILDGSISSPFFASGFSGSGWMMDAKTNTLTVDYLVVRKAMQVYEMVVNKISATNGSLWVSNASKVSDHRQLTEITMPEFTLELETAYKTATGNDFTVLDDVGKSILTSMLDGVNISFRDNDDFYKTISYGDKQASIPISMLHIVNSKALVDSKLFTDVNQLWDLNFLHNINLDFIEVTDPETGETSPTGSPIAEWSDEDFGLIHLSAQKVDFFSDNDEALYATMDIVSDDNKTIEKKYLYLDYFPGTENTFIVDFDEDEYPVFKHGDIVRCQKYDNQLIKYYDAIVLATVDLYSFVIQVATSVFDKYTEVQYDERGNIVSLVEKENQNLYDRSIFTEEVEEIEIGDEVIEKGVKVGQIEVGDSLVQVGNVIATSGRQNAIYLTSTDDQGPYINILSDLNRPDYSVLYKIPVLDDEGNYKTKLNEAGETEYEFEYTKTTKVRIGNLAGIVDYTFPADRQPRGFGLYGQNVYLTGDFYLNNGQSVIDASQDGIILKYKEAGLYIVDDPVTGEPSITLDANKVLIGDKDSQVGSLFEVIDGKAYIKTDYIRAQKIEVQEISNYSFGEEVKTKRFTQYSTQLPIPINTPSSGFGQPLNPPYHLAQADSWVTTMSGGSGVFVDKSLYPTATAFYSCVHGDQVHIMSPITSLKSGTVDGKITEAVLAFVLGSNIDYNVTNRMRAWVYSIDTSTRYDVPYTQEGSARGTFMYKLKDIQSEVATNNLIFGLSMVPETIEEIRQPFIDIQCSVSYIEGVLNWALWKDGSGSLAREGITWTKEGELTINSTFVSTNGVTTVELGNNAETAYLKMFENAQGGDMPLFTIEYQVGDEHASSTSTVVLQAYPSEQYNRYSTTELSAYSLNITTKDSNTGAKVQYCNLSDFEFNLETQSVFFGMQGYRGGMIIVDNYSNKWMNFLPDRGGLIYCYGMPGTGGSAWPTDKNAVSKGGVYNNSGFLCVNT